MVTLDWTTGHHDGVTLVTVRLRDIDEPTRVTVGNRLSGPVWPPRREGLPEAGWTDDGFHGVVGPGEHVLGYASPSEPADPPVELESADPSPDAAPVGETTESPAAVVRQLGDPAPPADAVPVDGRRDADPDEPPDPRTRDATPASGESEPSVDATPSAADSDIPRATLPDAVGPWLAEMARRVDRAEALATAESVPAATTAVRAAGGLDGVRDIAGPTDEQRLRVVARRARRLAERRAAADIPVEALVTLA